MNDADRAAIEAVEDACAALRKALNEAGARNIECEVEVTMNAARTVGSPDIDLVYGITTEYSRTTVERLDLEARRPTFAPGRKFDVTTGTMAPLRTTPGETLNGSGRG